MESGYSATLLEQDLHDLWYTFNEAAKVTDVHHPTQDRLVAQMLYAREIRLLKRETANSAGSK